MTFADLIYQAGFLQWVGMIVLASVIAGGIGRFRLWGNITTNKTKNVSKSEDDK